MCECVFTCPTPALSEVLSDEWGSLLLLIPSLALMLQRDSLLRLHTSTVRWTKDWGIQCVYVCFDRTKQYWFMTWTKDDVCMENCILCSVIKQKKNTLLYHKYANFRVIYRATHTLLILSMHSVWHVINAWIILVIMFGMLAHKICFAYGGRSDAFLITIITWALLPGLRLHGHRSHTTNTQWADLNVTNTCTCTGSNTRYTLSVTFARIFSDAEWTKQLI